MIESINQSVSQSVSQKTHPAGQQLEHRPGQSISIDPTDPSSTRPIHPSIHPSIQPIHPNDDDDVRAAKGNVAPARPLSPRPPISLFSFFPPPQLREEKERRKR
ncbi:hypothetical protein LY76DRAFT_598901 [Colletotrichum caudatum]|nr:hypothetical protein LY76DRAFT_598901 [Colletotrichum caudatum]